MEEAIFINYRRGEDQAAAGRLYDHLEGAFTRARIFIDVDSIPPGRDFTEELAERVNQCDIFLAIIGRHWADAVDGDGGRRLDNSEDWVRIEIESAQRLGKQIIPVLVDGAEMPRPDKLPESLRPLTRRNALRLTHERFRADAQGLIEAIAKLREDARARAEAGARKRAQEPATVEAAQSELAGRRQTETPFEANVGHERAVQTLTPAPPKVAARNLMSLGYVALAALTLGAVLFGLVFFRSPPAQPPPAKSTQANEAGQVSGLAPRPASNAALAIVPQQASPPVQPPPAKSTPNAGGESSAPVSPPVTNTARAIVPTGKP